MEGERRRAVAGAALLLAVFPAAYLAKPWIVSTTVVLCPFRAATGRPCLFCGLTRAFAHAMHGEFAAAFELHPLWWVAAALVCAAAMTLLAQALRSRTTPASPARRRPAVAWLAVGVVVVGSLLRAALAQG